MHDIWDINNRWRPLDIADLMNAYSQEILNANDKDFIQKYVRTVS